MLLIVFRKLAGNLWMILCLLLGSVLAVGMVCSIPIYVEGILQRMLIRDLESSQISEKTYPGYISMEAYFPSYYFGKSETDQLKTKMMNKMAELNAQMPIGPILSAEFLRYGYIYHTVSANDRTMNFNLYLGSQSQFQNHVNIIKGRFYQPDLIDHVIEVVASRAAMENSGMVMDKEYEVFSYYQKKDTEAILRVKIVGLYEPKDLQDVYWHQSDSLLQSTLVVDPEFLQIMASRNNNLVLSSLKLFSAFDYHRFQIKDTGKLVEIVGNGQRFCADTSEFCEFHSTFISTIEGYGQSSSELKLTLQIIIVPVLMMLLFFLFMVSHLKITSEAAAISVMESRGAGQCQILLIYVLESLVLGLLILVMGIPLGYLMVRFIGSTNGFLDFVNRRALEIKLNLAVLIYGVIAVLLIVLTTLLPVLQRSRISIVEQKLKRSRRNRLSAWQRLYLDMILLAVSLYAYSRLKAQLRLQQETGSGVKGMGNDILLFLASTLFILGAGLLLLRLHPLLLRLTALIGQRFFSPVLYLSFHQNSHPGSQTQFLMVFLFLTLSLGLFNANAARTINQNVIDNIRCKIGADIRLQEYWRPYDLDGNPIFDGLSADSLPVSQVKGRKYLEPDFERFSSLSSVEHATRVYRYDSATITKGGGRSNLIHLMAIDPYDFALTAWSRSDLNDYDLNEYMNVMMTTPRAILLSENIRDQLDMKIGDTILYHTSATEAVEGVVAAFINAWPGFEPTGTDLTGRPVENTLLVANLESFLSQAALQPYEIWLKKNQGITDDTLYKELAEAPLRITALDSASQLITLEKNNPKLQSTNGALTLSFLISMLICAVGFLIYWISSVKGRILQFGIMRAIGLSKGSAFRLLLCDQFLLSGSAIVIGILVGNLGSLLFVPLFQLVNDPASQIVPFRVIAKVEDANKIYIMLGCLLIICMAVLVRMILRIRVDQAIKLGEE